MEIATFEGRRHGGFTREQYASANDRGILVAERQTAGRTFAAHVGDGRVAVGRVEASTTVAMHEDEHGNRRAILQVARRFRLIGLTNAIRPSSPVGDAEASSDGTWTELKPEERCCYATFLLMVTACYLLMMILVFGLVLNFNACPDTRVATYVIVQGATVALNTVIGFFVIACKCGGEVYTVIAMLIYIFNVIWSGIGIWWLVAAGCSDSYLRNVAIGFTAPIWFSLLLVCCSCAIAILKKS